MFVPTLCSFASLECRSHWGRVDQVPECQGTAQLFWFPVISFHLGHKFFSSYRAVKIPAPCKEAPNPALLARRAACLPAPPWSPAHIRMLSHICPDKFFCRFVERSHGIEQPQPSKPQRSAQPLPGRPRPPQTCLSTFSFFNSKYNHSQDVPEKVWQWQYYLHYLLYFHYLHYFLYLYSLHYLYTCTTCNDLIYWKSQKSIRHWLLSMTVLVLLVTVNFLSMTIIMQSRDANASKDTIIRNGGAALHKLLTVLTLPTELWDKMSLYLYWLTADWSE